MLQYQPPGSPKLRVLVDSFIQRGSYPDPRTLDADEIGKLSRPEKDLLLDLYNLIEEEVVVADGEEPKKDSPWAKVREQIRDKVWEIIELNPDLLAFEKIQLQAIDKGAVPDPDQEESGMKYFRLPDWTLAHWKCGTPISVKYVVRSVHYKDGPGRCAGSGEVRRSEVPYCPTCDKEPADHGVPVYI